MPRDWPISRVMRLLTLLVCGLLVTGCRQEPGLEKASLSGATMGTTWAVTLYAKPGAVDVSALQQKLVQRLAQINRLMSTYDPDSEVSRFNNQTGLGCFSVSPETAEVVALAREISVLSSGAFDISVGPLVDLWGFGPPQRLPVLPSEEHVRGALARVGYQNVEICSGQAAIRKRIPTLRIDLSAVAKGYAVDDLAALLQQEGLSDFIVEIGGELKVSGRRGDGTPWRVGIEKPVEGARDIETVVALSETGMATSGNYRNYYVEDGERYVHTLDPVSGRPVRHKLASVSVLDSSCARADALATALMVMGEVKGRKFCEQNRIAAYFLIHDKGTIVGYRTPAFKTYLEKVKK